jgi:hypothetical protein
MAWLVTVTMTASYQKIFAPAHALAPGGASAMAQVAGEKILRYWCRTQRLIFNQRLDAVLMTMVLASMILILLVDLGQWCDLHQRSGYQFCETRCVASQWVRWNDAKLPRQIKTNLRQFWIGLRQWATRHMI